MATRFCKLREPLPAPQGVISMQVFLPAVVIHWFALVFPLKLGYRGKYQFKVSEHCIIDNYYTSPRY